jgi:hypothetical protein
VNGHWLSVAVCSHQLAGVTGLLLCADWRSISTDTASDSNKDCYLYLHHNTIQAQVTVHSIPALMPPCWFRSSAPNGQLCSMLPSVALYRSTPPPCPHARWALHGLTFEKGPVSV